ncbi:MAG: 4-vinyl reductase [Candidatus Nanohaloarchaeota archaeon QJJ-5]|nr:4-vinyl reductase [Candidatus Nanohaloarchaeota archaeon QJJ-5]
MSDIQDAFYDLAPHMIDIAVDDDGTIEYAGQRFVFFHTDMFAELFENMREVAGPVIDTKIKEFGYQAGQYIAERMDDAFNGLQPVMMLRLLVGTGFDIGTLKTIAPTDNRSQFEKIAGYGKYVGWLGDFSFEEYEDNERLVLTAKNTFESYSYGETGETQCMFLRHTFRGIVAYYWDADEIQVKETACQCKGDTVCRMVIERDT